MTSVVTVRSSTSRQSDQASRAESPAALSSAKRVLAIAAAHIANIGRLIEETETSMRQQLIDVYFDTTCAAFVKQAHQFEQKNREWPRELLQRELNEAINRSSPLVSCSKLLTD
uniref:F-actin-capping protein subunit beta n=1 Tax=Macrostomum lignano TaxID=282301 RepID=A0A1I8FQF7_9PLAT